MSSPTVPVVTVEDVEKISSPAAEPADGEVEPDLPEMDGMLFKWTNYVSGWQERYVVLRDGVISYYRSRDDVEVCRGSLNMHAANITRYDFDDLRFDVTTNETVYYLRGENKDDVSKWIDALENTKAALHEFLGEPEVPGDAVNMQRQSLTSMVSLASVASVASTRSKKIVSAEEKLIEMERYKDAIQKQIEGMITSLEKADNVQTDLVAFKATSRSMLELLEQCIGLVRTGEEQARLRVARERDRRRRVETELRALKQVGRRPSVIPEEGFMISRSPSIIAADEDDLDDNEFFDAMETAGDGPAQRALFDSDIGQHVDTLLNKPQEPTKGGWEVLVKQGATHIWRTDVQETEDQIGDTVLAKFTIPGVSAREAAWYFWSLSTRKEWDASVESAKVLAQLDEETMVLNQVYKRVQPAAPRDCTFLSHLRHIEDKSLVVNFSVNYSGERPPHNIVRATAQVGLLCETTIKDGAQGKKKEELTRDDIATKVFYASTISPGGWLPPAGVRATSKREYPRILNKFTKSCHDFMYRERSSDIDLNIANSSS